MSKLKLTSKTNRTTGVTALTIDLISPRKAVQTLTLQIGAGIRFEDITQQAYGIPTIAVKRTFAKATVKAKAAAKPLIPKGKYTFVKKR